MEQKQKRECEQYLISRIRAILDNWESIHETIDEMTPQERDMYVHRRITDDLARTGVIKNRMESYIASRRSTWKQIFMLDVIGVIVFFWIAFRDMHDLIGFAAIAVVLIVSRIVTYRLMLKATQILNEIKAHLDQETKTATFDFIVNGLHTTDK